MTGSGEDRVSLLLLRVKWLWISEGSLDARLLHRMAGEPERTAQFFPLSCCP